MDAKREALEIIRDFAGDRQIKFDTSLGNVTEQTESDILGLVDELETQFGIDLSNEDLVDVDTVGDLCTMVAQARQGD